MTDAKAIPKVFGLGLSKTGTKTLGTCLEHLGYDHFSWNEPFAERVLRGDVDEALRVARQHDSFEDLPWPAVFEALDANFPDAKFVLTERADPERWYQSLLRHAEYKGITEVRERFYGHALPHGRRDRMIDVYMSHNERVRRHFADRPGKLLVLCWEKDPGWEPLCDFLGHAVPARDIPHRNKRRRLKTSTLLRRIGYTAKGVLHRLT